MTLLRRLGGGAAVITMALALGTGPTKAVEIRFGELTPTPGCAASTDPADTGLICANSQTFTANGDTFTATGFSDHFTTPSALTLKTEPPDTAQESGLGENAAGATHCTDSFIATDCEIAGAASVAVVSKHGNIDAIVGSVQAGEDFTVWTGSSIAALTEVASGIGGTCTPTGTVDECLVTFTGAPVVGVESAGVGNVLLTSLSQPAVSTPEPATLALLGTALVGFGLVRRRRRT